MAYSNSALNPLIYTGFNENFKKGMTFIDVISYNKSVCIALKWHLKSDKPIVYNINRRLRIFSLRNRVFSKISVKLERKDI